ncbi:MAG TPA: OmpA family protein [Anditalea sp.]|nr:OmpA family protein [Anditalea sp.]
MKNNIKHILAQSTIWASSFSKPIAVAALILCGLQSPLQAQDTYTSPSWRFGVAGGGNFNFYRGTTQALNNDLTVPAGFRKGNGLGLFLAPVIEYHKADTRFGFMLQGGYDSRRGDFDQIITPCDCPADLSTNLSYVTIEPSLRFAPFKSSFFLFVGPRFAFNRDKDFTYQLGANPAVSDQPISAPVGGEFSNVEKNLISFQVGAGVDIPLSSSTRKTKFIMAPFASFHPYFGQNPRSVENWNNTTLRVGLALKLGRGRLIEKDPEPAAVLPAELPVDFSVHSPKNPPVSRNVSETFPLRNDVFFDLNSTAIPGRYVKLDKSQVINFKEDQLEVTSPRRNADRANRQLVVYYNILNILGDRLNKNPNATIKLVGSSEKNSSDGKLMAESIKTYLVDVFMVSANRITTEGNKTQAVKGETPELVLLRAGDRKVSIESSNSNMLMEFQSGPNAPLKPVHTLTAPTESYLTFNAKGSDKAYKSWAVEVKDEQGKVQEFGPYMDETIAIPGKSILGERPHGDYKITMVGQSRSGKEIRKEVPAHLVLWTPPTDVVNTRFSVIYDFDQSEAIKKYETYLTEVVAQKIPTNAKVMLLGYTDVIGDPTHNRTLSLARANDVKEILEKALASKGRRDVTFEIRGIGEDESLSPFNNNFPEERAYNRTVVIDIIPQ